MQPQQTQQPRYHQQYRRPSQPNPYQRTQTTPQEKVLFFVKKSRKAYLDRYIMIILLVGLASYSFTRKTILMSRFFWIFLIIAAFLLIVSEILLHTKRLIVTNRRSILNEGILKHHSTTINYSLITEISSRQSFFQRILNVGDLTIHTSGGKLHDLNIDRISSPGKIKKTMEHLMSMHQAHHR